MAYNVGEDELAKSVSDAVRKLRKEIGESQQQFAYRMKTAIRTVARYETVRPPKGKVLRQLETIADEHGLRHLAEVFRGALNQEVGVRNAKKARYSHLAILYARDQMIDAFDKYVKAVNSQGCTVNAIRLEFDASDGTTYVADVAPPELQKVVGPDGKKVARKVAPNCEIGPCLMIVDFAHPPVIEVFKK